MFLISQKTQQKKEICRANQWTGLYMIGDFDMKELKEQRNHNGKLFQCPPQKQPKTQPMF